MRAKRWAGLVAAIAAMAALAVASWYVTGRDDRHETASPSRSSNPPTSDVQASFDRAYARAVPGTTSTSWAATVRFFVGGRPAGLAVGADASRPTTWDGCPRGITEYEGRRCPVSIAQAVGLADAATLVVEPGAPAVVGCSRATAPAGTARLRAVSIRPDDEHRDCFSDFAVTLYIDDADQVTAVNLVLSSP